MSSLELMKVHLDILSKKAVANLTENGFLVPVAIAFTPTLEKLIVPGNKLSCVEDIRQWSELIRHILAKHDASFYIIISEANVKQGDNPAAEAIVIQAVHRTGKNIAMMIPFCRKDGKVTLSDAQLLEVLGGPLGESLFA